MNRLADVKAFYRILLALEDNVGGKRLLAECSTLIEWPRRGVYFFFEPGEVRLDSGSGPRVVRVGTHATTAGAQSSLWGRLSQHRGSAGSGGGNHRTSIMRLLVGVALQRMSGIDHADTWGIGQNSTKACTKLSLTSSQLREGEYVLEAAVSEYIRAMPFLWVNVDDAPGPESDRKLIEKNSIGLLSNWLRTPIDPASRRWLGALCNRPKVQGSGLWNNVYVKREYDPQFLGTLEGYANRTRRLV